MVLDRGCLGEHLLAIQGLVRLVGAEHVAQRIGVSGGRKLGNVESGNIRRMFEHRPELLGEPRQLIGLQAETCQPRDVGHVIA